MDKYITGFCYRCGKTTKHKVIECEDSTIWRVFEGILTLGLSLTMPQSYQCECTKCGEINKLIK